MRRVMIRRILQRRGPVLGNAICPQKGTNFRTVETRFQKGLYK